MSDERKPEQKGPRAPTGVPAGIPAGKKDPGRADRLAKQLRGNIDKRKFQSRMRRGRG
ncbi:MAG TPA: hypothetical protein VGA19_08545 [Rhodospirillales bacterium]|jgi:hypothetical protein